MAMIFLVFALILLIYSIIIYSLFQDAGEASDIEYNVIAEEMNLNRTLFKVSLHFEVLRLLFCRDVAGLLVFDLLSGRFQSCFK